MSRKSEVVAEIARTLGVPVIDVKLSRSQPSDFLGNEDHGRDFDAEAEAERYQREIEA